MLKHKYTHTNKCEAMYANRKSIATKPKAEKHRHKIERKKNEQKTNAKNDHKKCYVLPCTVSV